MLRAMLLPEYLSGERGRATKVAARAGLTPAFLHQVAKGARPAPADKCPAIERATDYEVRRWHLRPLDWHVIWPELIGMADAPSIPTNSQAA